MRKVIIIISFCWIYTLSAQSTDFPINHPVYEVADIEDTRQNIGFSSTIKPYSRESIIPLVQPKWGDYLSLEVRDHTYDSSLSKKPFLNHFYEYPADAYYYEDENVVLHINPAGQATIGATNDDISTTYISSRGIEIRGMIDRRIAFYTSLTENQARYPEYVNDVRDSTLVVPYEGFWKQFNDTGVDFLRAQGYLDFGVSKSISAQLGFGKHFIGNGYRSLVLSNFANNYPYLRVNTQTKIFDYTNIYAEMIANVRGGSFGLEGTGSFSKKYMALHHLNIKLRPNLHVGLFESVIYGDSTRGLKFEYLNPVIFYRAVEQQNGSADNAFVGMDFKWNIKRRFALYGQFMIDELVVSEALAGDGWWGNKQGIQLGVKYIDALGIRNLVLQGELNRVRPYMYAHQDGFTSYSHYNQALAHPLGANFTEFLLRSMYRLNDRWNFEASMLSAQYGNDVGDTNFGRDILKSFGERRLDENGMNIDFGNDHLQGIRSDLLILFVRTTYMFKHNVFVDLDLTYRSETDEFGRLDSKYSIFGLSFRWNIPGRQYLF